MYLSEYVGSTTRADGHRCFTDATCPRNVELLFANDGEIFGEIVAVAGVIPAR